MFTPIAVMPMNGQEGGQNGRKRRDNEGAYSKIQVFDFQMLY